MGEGEAGYTDIEHGIVSEVNPRVQKMSTCILCRQAFWTRIQVSTYTFCEVKRSLTMVIVINVMLIIPVNKMLFYN